MHCHHPKVGRKAGSEDGSGWQSSRDSQQPPLWLHHTIGVTLSNVPARAQGFNFTNEAVKGERRKKNILSVLAGLLAWHCTPMLTTTQDGFLLLGP